MAVFALFAFAYIWASPSLARQHWDSLDYARACEVRGPRAIWGNHPLGHLLECGAVTAIRRLGYQGRALPIIKVFNGVTAAAAVAALLVVMATVLRLGLLRSVGWAVALGGTYGSWHYAGTADVYSFSVLLMIAAWGVIVWSFDRPSYGRSLLSGIAFGFATLAHQFGGVILMVGTIGLLRLFKGRGWRRLVAALGIFSGAAAVTIVVGYGLLGILATGSSSPSGIVGWIVGHGNNPSFGRFFTLGSASIALRFAAITLLGDNGKWLIHFPLSVVAVSCLALSLASAFWIRRLPDRLQTIALSCGLQYIIGSLLIVWWDPNVAKLWVLTLPALVMWCALALAGLGQSLILRRHGRNAQSTWLPDAVPLLLGVLLLLSTSAVMLRERQPDVGFERSLNSWVEHSGPDDVLIENGRLTAHLLFWERRPGTVSLSGMLRASQHESDRFVKLRQVIEQAARRGHAVLISPGLGRYHSDDRLAVFGVTRRQVGNFFDQYPREGPLFEVRDADGDVRPVYRLVLGAK